MRSIKGETGMRNSYHLMILVDKAFLSALVLMHVKFTRVIEMSWSREVIFKCPYRKKVFTIIHTSIEKPRLNHRKNRVTVSDRILRWFRARDRPFLRSRVKSFLTATAN